MADYAKIHSRASGQYLKQAKTSCERDAANFMFVAKLELEEAERWTNKLRAMAKNKDIVRDYVR